MIIQKKKNINYKLEIANRISRLSRIKQNAFCKVKNKNSKLGNFFVRILKKIYENIALIIIISQCTYIIQLNTLK